MRTARPTTRGSSSSYDLKLSGSSVPVRASARVIKKVIDDDSVSVDFEVQKGPGPLEGAEGQLSVDKEKAGINQQVKLTVDITPRTASYVGIGYNVVSIQIFRKKPEEDVFKRIRFGNRSHRYEQDALREGLETEGSGRGQERARRLRAHRGARHGHLAVAGDCGRLAQAGGGAGDSVCQACVPRAGCPPSWSSSSRVGTAR